MARCRWFVLQGTSTLRRAPPVRGPERLLRAMDGGSQSPVPLGPRTHGLPFGAGYDLPMDSEPVIALVEVPKGSRNKYEHDEASGHLRLDRVLYSPLHYPADYGFILGTLAEDGDHLDALIVTYEPTFPGCLVPVRPVGVLDMRDE